MTHLHPYMLETIVDGSAVQLHVTFGFHVFTDDKENGAAQVHRQEERYFCPERYDLSLNPKAVLSESLLNGYVAAYHNKKRTECYFHLDSMDYALFLEIRKPTGTNDQLKLHVVSAYEVDTWGKSALPNGKKFKFSFVLSKRLRGESLLKRKGK